MATPSGSGTAKMNMLVVYWCGTVFFLVEAAYHWFGQHNAVKALGDIAGAFVGLCLIWYGRYIWRSLRRAFPRSSTDKTMRR
jgi:hypothetical protein